MPYGAGDFHQFGLRGRGDGTGAWMQSPLLRIQANPERFNVDPAAVGPELFTELINVWNTMSPEQQQQLRDRFHRMTPEQRDRLRERVRDMTPEQRQRLRDRMQRDRRG